MDFSLFELDFGPFGLKFEHLKLYFTLLELLMAFLAEEFFGVADITGAFAAGLVLLRNRETAYISRRFDIVSYMLLSPIFFASIVRLVNKGNSLVEVYI